MKGITMKGIAMNGIGTNRIIILATEWFITALIVLAGLSGKQILFINGPRTAVITLGLIGFAIPKLRFLWLPGVS